MLARRPSPRRPPLSAPRGQLRAAYRLSAGHVARRAGAGRGGGGAGDRRPPGPARLPGAGRGRSRELQDLPEEERLRQLEQMAWCVLEMALADSDWRAAAFIADQMRRGRNPARTLAHGVIKAQARAAAPPPTPAAEPAAPPTPRPPGPTTPSAPRCADPPPRCAPPSPPRQWPTQSPCCPKSAAPAATASTLPMPVRPRRLDALASRLRVGTATPPATDTDPRGLLRAWAQGP